MGLFGKGHTAGNGLRVRIRLAMVVLEAVPIPNKSAHIVGHTSISLRRFLLG